MNTQDKHLEQWAAYNLGNAFFNQAQAAEQSAPDAANEIYQKALNFFKQAIEIDPTDKIAKYNYELAAKKIIEQKQKSQQDHQQNKQDKQDKQENQDKQNQENKSQDQQQKDQQDKQENKQDEKQNDANNSGSEQNQAQQSAEQNAQQGQMTQSEAMMLLENFQKAEDQKKAMDLQKAQQQTSSGGKDW
jgi:Ca-activated chloride channel homolog